MVKVYGMASAWNKRDRSVMLLAGDTAIAPSWAFSNAALCRGFRGFVARRGGSRMGEMSGLI